MHRHPASNVFRPTRRALLAGLAGATLAPAAAFAQSSESPLEALTRAQAVREWQQKFDAGANAAQAERIKSETPLLSPETVVAIEAALPMLRDQQARGGWPKIQSPMRLKVGSRSEVIARLRQRLVASGDMPPDQARMGYHDTFDSYVDAAVRRFQVRHGLRPDGVVDETVMEVMNVPIETRISQLEMNLVRIRSMSGNLGERYIFMNIPAAELEMVEQGRVVERHNAVVGKIDRQTPILSSSVREINFHPYWHVPVSIIRKDLIPKMQTEPDYLTKNHIRIFDNHGQEVPPEAVDWNSVQATTYSFRQDPGGDNAMSTVKVTFPNTHDVYMHDTPFKDLFGDNNRFYSSGCMRIQNIQGLVTWLLRDTPGWTPEAVANALADGQRLDAKLKTPVPVYTNYITAWATAEGIVHFRDDIYNKDGVGMLVAQE
ncbi:MAG: L,D-transpeptidase family protein [Hyphomicrobiales bacterium]|nr:L,D-transpeptidase family protein [Hyphomicrobiales bacterium]